MLKSTLPSLKDFRFRPHGGTGDPIPVRILGSGITFDAVLCFENIDGLVLSKEVLRASGPLEGSLLRNFEEEQGC